MPARMKVVAKQYGVRCIFLMDVKYITSKSATHNSIIEMIAMVRRRQRLSRDGYIPFVFYGSETSGFYD